MVRVGYPHRRLPSPRALAASSMFCTAGKMEAPPPDDDHVGQYTGKLVPRLLEIAGLRTFCIAKLDVWKAYKQVKANRGRSAGDCAGNVCERGPLNGTE
jgi:hypothetical protein